MSSLTTQELKADVVYRAARWSAGAYGNFGQRLGTEMIADRNGQGSIVDRQTLYENRMHEVGAEATVVWHRGAGRYVLHPSIVWSTSTARYLAPRREMIVSRLGATLRGEASWLLDNWRLAATAGVGYYAPPREGLRLDALADYLAEYLTRTAARLNCRHLAPGSIAACRTPAAQPHGLLRRAPLCAPLLPRRQFRAPSFGRLRPDLLKMNEVKP